MSLTGAFLILFVTFHALMNGVAIFWPTAYNVVCEFLGANWYALVGSLVLAAGFIVHILYALWLTVQNRRARGHERYAVTSRPPQVEWSSKNMLILGFVVVAFLVLHLIQFWAKMQLAEICGCPGETVTTASGATILRSPAAGTLFLQEAFAQWWVLVAYIVAFVALWFHMTHGFWSMFQSCGWNGRTWLPRLKKCANWFTTIIIALFIAEAVVFFVQAQNNYYLENPELNMQYVEMAATHNGEADAPCTAADKTPCGKTVCDGQAHCNDCNADTPCADAPCITCTGCEGCAEGCDKCEGCANGCAECAGCTPAPCAANDSINK